MQRYTLMISVRDKARADIAVSADRIYYRFATADTVDEGDIPEPGEQLDLLVARLADAMRPLEGESPIADDDFSAKLFVDNKLQPNPNLTPEAVRRLANLLRAHDDAFAFILGFC